MDEEQKPPRVVVTAAWRKEQQAKREAYEAKRRAWVRTFERGTEAEEDESPAPGETAASSALETRGARVAPGADGGAGQFRTSARRASHSDTPGPAALPGEGQPEGWGNTGHGMEITTPDPRPSRYGKSRPRRLWKKREKRRGPRGPRRGASPEGRHLGGR